MEEEGWYSYHEQSADGTNHLLVITDTTYRLNPIEPQYIHFHLAGTEEELNKIGHWSAERGMSPTRWATKTDNYKAPNAQKEKNTSVLTEHGDLPSQLEIYEYTGAYSYSTPAHGDKQARIRVEEWESGMKRFFGVSGVRFPASRQLVHG